MNNIGQKDRAIRAIFGLCLISLVFIGPRTVWGWVGLIPLVTAMLSFCPFYSLLGLRTCKQEDDC